MFANCCILFFRCQVSTAAAVVAVAAPAADDDGVAVQPAQYM